MRRNSLAIRTFGHVKMDADRRSRLSEQEAAKSSVQVLWIWDANDFQLPKSTHSIIVLMRLLIITFSAEKIPSEALSCSCHKACA